MHIESIVSALRGCGQEVDIVGPVRVQTVRAAAPSRLGRIKRRLPRLLLEIAQLAYNAVSLLQLFRQLRRCRYDFIYERYALFNVAGLVASRVFGVPLVLEVNTPYAQAWSRYYGLRLKTLARVLERFTLCRADVIVTVTEAQRHMLEQIGVHADAVIVSHNAVDPEEFQPDVEPAAELAAVLPARAAMIVGFVGTMNRWQGVHGFADVIRRVMSERSDVGFLFVGDGEGRAQLEGELRRLDVQGAATFLGRRPHREVPRLVRAMDVGVLLDSNVYGSPMKIFEYWAMGKAVIAPRVPPVLEVLREGETGLLIDPGDSAAMAACILRLARDPALRKRLGGAGRAEVLARHTWSRNAQAILDAFQRRCVAKTRRAGNAVVP